MTTDYIELRTRSAFSFLEGAAAPEDLIDRAVALEYPAQDKARFDRMVEMISRGFDRIADDGCGDNLFTAPQPASAAPAAPKPDEAKPAKPN